MQTVIHIHIQTDRQTDINKYIYTYIHTYTPTYKHKYMHNCILKNIGVIEVCPSNIRKPFSMIKKKDVTVGNEHLFWPRKGRFFRQLRADSTSTVLRCQRLHLDFEVITPLLRQNSWESCEVAVRNATCAFLTLVSMITADSEEYEATMRRNIDLMEIQQFFPSRLAIVSPIRVCVTGD